ncbi:hypothetical protein GCM10025857_57930 [Alicyclobacillus contaminans]|nr:hypothetical protein GCM10025857_57930 [Alicyclobacillus contaminans]GMA71709.1 hypothetical protein GCM10025885_07580 [Tetragenococcus osmophilus]
MKLITAKFNLKEITPHGLRHTHCSLLFEMGSSSSALKKVQERLGHKTIRTTLSVYTHATRDSHQEIATEFDKYMKSKDKNKK